MKVQGMWCFDTYAYTRTECNTGAICRKKKTNRHILLLLLLLRRTCSRQRISILCQRIQLGRGGANLTTTVGRRRAVRSFFETFCAFFPTRRVWRVYFLFISCFLGFVDNCHEPRWSCANDDIFIVV